MCLLVLSRMPTTVTEEKVDAIEESGNRWQGTTSGRKISMKYPANRLTKKKKKGNFRVPHDSQGRPSSQRQNGWTSHENYCSMN